MAGSAMSKVSFLPSSERSARRCGWTPLWADRWFGCVPRVGGGGAMARVRGLVSVSGLVILRGAVTVRGVVSG